MKRVVATKSAAAMYNPVSQATLAPNGMLYTAAENCIPEFPSCRDSRPSVSP